jgi:hypothetical protein
MASHAHTTGAADVLRHAWLGEGVTVEALLGGPKAARRAPLHRAGAAPWGAIATRDRVPLMTVALASGSASTVWAVWRAREAVTGLQPALELHRVLALGRPHKHVLVALGEGSMVGGGEAAAVSPLRLCDVDGLTAAHYAAGVGPMKAVEAMAAVEARVGRHGTVDGSTAGLLGRMPPPPPSRHSRAKPTAPRTRMINAPPPSPPPPLRSLRNARGWGWG